MGAGGQWGSQETDCMGCVGQAFGAAGAQEDAVEQEALGWPEGAA